MKVTLDNGVYKSSRISGPNHNYLGMSFSQSEVVPRVIPKRLTEDDSIGSAVDGEKVLGVVRQVVADMTSHLSISMYVATVEFVPTDSNSLEAYEELARVITKCACEDRN